MCKSMEQKSHGRPGLRGKKAIPECCSDAGELMLDRLLSYHKIATP